MAAAIDRIPDGAKVTRWRPFFRIIALISSISLTACGGEPPSSQAAPGVGQAFAARATDVCQKALEAKQAWSAFPASDFDPIHPDPSAFPEVAVWLEDQVAPTFKAWLDGLRALGVPPTGHEAWNDVLAAVEKIVQLNADQVAAAKAGDTGAFVATTSGLKETQIELERATAAAGVARCADEHKK